MKKTLLSIIILSSIYNVFAMGTISPVSPIYPVAVSYTSDTFDGQAVCLVSSYDNVVAYYIDCQGSYGTITYSDISTTGYFLPVDNYYIFELTYNPGGWGTLAELRSLPQYIGELNFQVSSGTPMVDPIEAYVSSSTVNADFELLTGFNMRGTAQWIGDYLIKNFIGNLYGFFYDFRDWIVVLFIMGGVLYFVNRAFRFYRH